jgi:hypothetical protein
MPEKLLSSFFIPHLNTLSKKPFHLFILSPYKSLVELFQSILETLEFKRRKICNSVMFGKEIDSGKRAA